MILKKAVALLLDMDEKAVLSWKDEAMLNRIQLNPLILEFGMHQKKSKTSTFDVGVSVSAFTLIELLVVISIIALLVAILMPALSKAKQQATAAVCLANSKQLAMGWFMYANDNDEHIMRGYMSGTNDLPADCWIGWPRTAAGAFCGYSQTTPVTDDDEIRGIKMGRLFEYIDAADVYHCPGDNKRISISDKTRVFVTYAIPACLNGTWGEDEKVTKLGEIKSPSSRYNFVETAETRNWNMGGQFPMGTPARAGGKWKWWGPMAVNHGDSSILGFCDGHAERRIWQNPYTIRRVQKLIESGTSLYGQDSAEAGQTEDIAYMARGWAISYPYNY